MTMATVAPIISVDLVEAARRSEHFPSDWSPEKVRRAVERYEKFLRLAAKHPGATIAPTRDIDEMWHLHMLSPRAYYNDCIRLMGRILDHDGGFGQDPGERPILGASFNQTATLWEQEYGESYVGELPPSETTVKCWHDCQGRCWHACSNKVDTQADSASPQRDAIQ